MRVDIKASENMDRLIFTPRKWEDVGLIKRLLAKDHPDIRFKTSAEGLCVEANDVAKLNLNEVGLDFSWSELAERFLINRQHTYKYFSAVIDEIKKLRNCGKELAEIHLKKINGLEILDDHQWVNVACMTIPEGFGLCVFDEQGAGKTVTLIYAFDVLVERDEVDFALIIAPKSMVSEWPVDFNTFMSDRYKVNILTGNQLEKRKVLSGKADVIVTNFETAISMEQELRALLRKYGSRSILVVDESFFIKNLDAKRTQSIRRLREYCGRAFVLCGTPAPNSPVDLIPQFNIVDFGMTFSGVNIPKNKNEAGEIIHRIIEERGPFVRHLKADVMPDLLAKQFQRVNIPMQPQQADLYRKTKEALATDLREIDDQTFERKKMSFFARRSALLQICSTPSSIDIACEEVPGKILALDKILEDLISKQGEKVILWSFYTASLDNIVSRYQKYNPVRYDGTVTEITARREAVRSFREDVETMLFVGNPAAAGAGLNLQSARFAIYESMSNQAAHYLQSLDRIHRRGQKNQVEYLILLCDGTIEISEYNRLIEKEHSAQKILGDPTGASLTREMMLAELFL
ncbi:MAG: DEAD/DEAH box helicase [Chitinophagaceae bacterium]